MEHFKAYTDEENRAYTEYIESVSKPCRHYTPALPAGEYAGRYEHPAYGVLDVYIENGRLYARLGTSKFAFEHYTGNSFVTEIPAPDAIGYKMRTGFAVNADGNVVGYEFPAEPMLKEPIRFVKKQDNLA